MPIGWMTALKMVPWSDVIENAPTLVNGARKLFTRTRDESVAAPPPVHDVAAAAQHAGQGADQRLALLAASLEQTQARVASLESESRETAALIKSLAEQQAQMIAAIDALGRRARLLTGVASVLAVACVALAGVLLSR